MNKPTGNEIVAFYDVPLVCGAAPAIGCGSRAKPFLIDLERQAAIDEAWLNRTGTIVAIVRSGPVRAADVANMVFERHEIQYRERLDDKPSSFRKEGSWFRGAEVDRLSLEEAREIAEIAVASAVRKKLVPDEEAAQIESDVKRYFREELVKFRSKQELVQDIQGKFPQATVDIYEKHIGTEKTALVLAHGIRDPFNRTDREETISCC
jgi:hypothetical protein